MAGTAASSLEFIGLSATVHQKPNRGHGEKGGDKGSHLGDCYGQRGLGVAQRRDGADDGALLKFGGDWDSVTAGREQSGGL